jgi:TPR repeat protein
MDISQALIDRAKEGDGAAIYYIGSLYHHCQKYTKAWEWLQLAAEKNNSGALHMMGLMCENGNGVKADILESLSWYLKAAKLGDLGSCLCIASLFEKGYEMAIDYQRAADWYMQGCGEVPEDKNYTKITPSGKALIMSSVLSTPYFDYL